MTDRYKNFQELSQHETEGVDFSIDHEERAAAVAIVAPHGGTIEPCTSELTREIAGGIYSYYCFNENKNGKNRRSLHITSTRFDEPRAMKVIAQVETVIGIHGCTNNEGNDLILLGGLDVSLLDIFRSRLTEAGYSCLMSGHKFPATHSSNICNRGSSERGVQIELPWDMRQLFLHNFQERYRFTEVVRAALAGYLEQEG